MAAGAIAEALAVPKPGAAPYGMAPHRASVKGWAEVHNPHTRVVCPRGANGALEFDARGGAEFPGLGGAC